MKTIILITLCSFLLTPGVNAQNWVQKGVDIDGFAAGDQSGNVTSMPDANTIAIGSPSNDENGDQSGHVRIYEWNGNFWSQKGNNIVGEAIHDRSGSSLSMPDANTVAIGAIYNNGTGSSTGHVRVFEWDGSTWVQKGVDIDGEADNDQFGFSVSMPDANTVAIGAIYNDGNGSSSGHVRIFEWDGTNWIQKGMDIDGESNGDQSGYAISMPDANTIAIGARYNYEHSFYYHAGHVRIYEWNGSIWSQKGTDLDGEEANDNFGRSVSMPDANTVAVGAPNHDGFGGIQSGRVSVFSWNGSSWVQKGMDIDGTTSYDYSGTSVYMPDVNTVAVGEPVYGVSPYTGAGRVRIFSWTGSSWSQLGNGIIGEAALDESGVSVSMPDANTISIGAIDNDGNGASSGHARIYSLCYETTGTDVQTACDSYTWIDGYTYTSSNNTSFWVLENSAGCDSVVTLDLTITNSNTGTDIQTACDSYTWIDGNTYTASNNTAIWTLTNAAGCDSIVTLDLTINSVSDVTTSTSGLTITANASGASYQWLDCDNSNTPIIGETGQSFTALTNGNYAVELTENGCVDTSDCVAITTVGIIENTFNEEFTLYPNPTDGLFSIEFNSTHEIITLKILDASGRLIESKNYNQIDLIVYELNQPKGIYLIEVSNGKGQHSLIRLVKQ